MFKLLQLLFVFVYGLDVNSNYVINAILGCAILPYSKTFVALRRKFKGYFVAFSLLIKYLNGNYYGITICGDSEIEKVTIGHNLRKYFTSRIRHII